MLPNYDSSQHPATPLAPQPQRPMSHQPPEQLRVGQGAGVTTDALELRLAALFRFGCPRLARRIPRDRPGVPRERSGSLPISGRIGVSRSILCSGLLSDGGTSQTIWALRVRLGDAWRATSLGPCAAV